MAAKNFSESMTGEELCAFLIERGMVEEDALMIKDQGYSGKTIMLLNQDYRDMFHRLSQKMLCASSQVLKKFLDDQAADCLLSNGQPSPARNASDDPLESTDHGPEARHEWHTCRPKLENEVYTSFKLGYGVDGSDPTPFRNSSSKVRKVLLNLSNIKEETKIEKHFYTKTISSMETHTSSVNFSVSDLVGQVLTLYAEAEYSREVSKEMTVVGEMVATRSVSFKPNLSADSNFEEDFCNWMVHNMPEISAQRCSKNKEKVEMYLHMKPNMTYDVLGKVHRFLKEKKITHYISGVDLGAAVYSMSVTSKKKSIRGAGSGAGVEYLAEAKAGIKSKKEEVQKMSKKHYIGDFDKVQHGKGEGVIGYKLLPIYTLIDKKHLKTKQLLQSAIQYYLQEQSGPFKISCGDNFKMFLKVTSTDTGEVLTGTANENEASFFHIERTVCPGEFSIAYGEESGVKGNSRYVKTDSRLTGRDKGPLRVSGKAAKFTLRHSTRKKEDLSTDFWETDACYVKLASRTTQKKSYLGFDEHSMNSICVPQRKEEEEKTDIWLRFHLKRVNICNLRPRINSLIPCALSFDNSEVASEDGLAADDNYSVEEAVTVSSGCRVQCDFGEIDDTCLDDHQPVSLVLPGGGDQDEERDSNSAHKLQNRPEESEEEDEEEDYDFEHEFEQISDSD